MSPDISVDPSELPRDWRSVVRVGAFIVLLTIAVGAVAAPVSLTIVRPIEARLEHHLAEVASLRPTMDHTVATYEKKLQAIDEKLDVLLEDCYRRGGCRSQR